MMLVMLFSLLATYLSFVSFDISESVEITDDGLYLIEGDMLSRQNPWLRAAIKGKQWPNATVYYEYENEDEYDDDELELIQSSMKYVEDNSCVKFVQRKSEPCYVQIRAMPGCSSEVGYKAVVRQQLILENPRCMTKGIIIHELMHILGFLHEQSRNDRDEYITIHSDNIKTSKLDNFEKSSSAETDHLGQPYDYKSIMHYKSNDYAIDVGKPTITPKDSNIKASELGVSKANGVLSEIDKKKLNKYYNCAAKN